MTTFSLSHPFVSDAQLQRNFEDALKAINAIAQFIDYGNGAPTHSPTGRRIYIRLNGGVGTTIYVWSGAAWNAIAGV